MRPFTVARRAPGLAYGVARQFEMCREPGGRQIAMQAGEITREEAVEPKRRLGGKEICLNEHSADDFQAPARLDALRQVSRAREKLLGDALDTARERLAHLRSDSSYADILRAPGPDGSFGCRSPQHVPDVSLQSRDGFPDCARHRRPSV